MTHPLIDQAVMLADPQGTIGGTAEIALQRLADDGCSFEVKWDGVRCLAHVAHGTVALRNRRGADITDRYPEVARDLLDWLPEGIFTFDGEVVAFGEDGLPSFDLLSRRDRLTKPERIKAVAPKIPVCFIIFDVLYDRATDTRSIPQAGRRAIVDSVGREISQGGFNHLRVGPASTNAEVMWGFVEDRKMEGLIAKRPTGLYHAGRSPNWVKVKRSATASFIVSGYEPGQGRTEGMVGALYLHLLDDDRAPVDRGKVGTGFTQAHRKYLRGVLDGDEVLNGKPWHPDLNPMIVEVEFASVTKDGALRFPSYRGLRHDLSLHDCTTRQEGVMP